MIYGKNNKRHLFGYSFIELMIVIMTMTLLFSFGMANYRDFQRRQSLEASVRQVRSDLELAREFALAGKFPPACMDTSLDSYRFILDTANDDYTIVAVCDGGAIIVDIGKSDIKVPPGFDISGSLSLTGALDFLVLGRGVDSVHTYTLTSKTDSSLTKTIRVSLSGQID